MEFITLPGTNLEVSRVCLGTMTFGEQNTEAQAHQQLNYALDQGINFIDTAEMYPVPAKADTQGLTEAYVGTWLKGQPRDKIVLATKVSGPNRGMTWMRGGPQFTKTQILQACDQSLQRLQTDYIDLYQLHWPARNVPMFGETYFDPLRENPDAPEISDQLRALSDLVVSGKVRAIGISNETPWGVMKFKEMGKSLGLPVISTLQNPFNLLNRSFENGLAEVCFRENVALLAYSPLAFGLLSGKYIESPEIQGRMTMFSNFGSRYHKPQVPEAVMAYAQLAKAAGLTPTQLALGWVKSQWFVASTILGATTMDQLKENIGSFHQTLSLDVQRGIEEIHRRFMNPAQ